MEFFGKNTLDLAATSPEVGNDDADPELRGGRFRVTFQDAARPIGSSTDFAVAIDQTDATGVARGLGQLALFDFDVLPDKDVKNRCWTGVGSINPAMSMCSGTGISLSSMRSVTNAGSSAPDNQPFSRHRRRNS